MSVQRKPIVNKSSCVSVLTSLLNSELLSVDTETDGFNFWKNKIGCVTITNDGENGYFIPIAYIKKHLDLFIQVLKTAKRITTANGKFDWKFFYRIDVFKDCYIPYTDDITLLLHVINSSIPKGLKPGAIFTCGKFVGYDDELDKYKKRFKINNYLQIPISILKKYATLDVIVNWREQKYLDKLVKQIDKKYPNEKDRNWTIERFYREIMIPNANAVTEIEIEGVYIDIEQFKISETFINEKIKELRKELSEIWKVPLDFKFESTTELGKLFEKMNFPQISVSKAGNYATGDDILTEYELLNIPGIKTLRKFRSYSVAQNTFINGYRDCFIEHEDGTVRMHANCNLFGTESFRHAMNDPNLQQTPSRGEISKYIKKLFATPDQYYEYSVIDDSGNIYKGKGTDYILTDRGKIRFNELTENDIILNQR